MADRIVNIDGKRRYYCQHCGEYILKTLFYQHKRLYFDSRSRKWQNSRLIPADTPMVHPDKYHDNEIMDDSTNDGMFFIYGGGLLCSCMCFTTIVCCIKIN